ncbi:HAD family hydrolase [Clostridium tarantellae]|uniref:Cof-type HAD-IIB family hydrolase n=1 Tax=Clostridium tarantellae TaxID=39493 RepID=A0A6I1MLJ8_9CLOT|nr:HAD family hydrolase [Clostridium tarantellae]MPQ43890.1 Cof-type HAD-IIB family hydrolase [Clostridium tarantellae]
MVKFIATDMDGTLLNNNDEINPEFFDIFKKLRKNGVIFAAASGRQYYNLLKKFEKVKDDMMFIAENGTFVVYKGKELVANPLKREITDNLIDIGNNIEDAYLVVCGKKSAYIKSKDEKFVKEVAKYYERYKIVSDFNNINDDILKVTLCDFKGSEKNSYKYFSKYKDKLQVTVSGEIWLDITAKGVNKGVAMDKIKETLNINYDEVMVFGDYLNDLELMKSGYYSYAMENAHKDLKKVARFIAKSNNENGVVEKIKEVLNL